MIGSSLASSIFKYSAFALPLIAIVLVQYIHGYESGSHQVDFPNNFEFDSNVKSSEARDDPLKNISSRSFDSSDRTLKLPDLSHKYKPGVIAYHRVVHNVSWAITIPLFTFLLPIADSGDPTSLPNQALYGFFAAVITVIAYAIPNLYNGAVPRARSLQQNKITLDHLMHPGHLVNLVGISMQNQIGIDPMQCLQKTICEAYRSPQNKRYGGLALPFQYFIPARNETDASLGNIYQIAAREGKFTKTDCRKKYDCIFDILDLATYLLSSYKRAKAKSEGYNPS